MERSHWIYRNQECGLNIEKVPIYLERINEEGDKEKGAAYFQSGSLYDEVWGSDCKFEVSWETVNRETYHHGKKVRETINMYNAIQVSITKKQTEWVRSHEMTYWQGSRKQIKQKRFYASNMIHSVMLCEQTNRVVESNATIISVLFPNYEQLILDTIKSINCHGI